MSVLPPLSAMAKFDDLMRCSKELTSGLAEESELRVKMLKKLKRKQNFENFQNFCCFCTNMRS